MPTLNDKDYSAYGLGRIVTFQLDLDPSKDTVPWKDYNMNNPFIVVWLEDQDSDTPRFEAGYGPVYFELDEKGITRALFETLKILRISESEDESEGDES